MFASVGGKRVAIQAKRYALERKVGNRAVQEAIAGASCYVCDFACVVTQTSFTKPARAQAEACDPHVVLVERTGPAGLAGRMRELTRRSA